VKTKVLLLHTSVGYGIKVTAENIFKELQKSPDFESRIEDIQKVQSGVTNSVIQNTYVTILDYFSGLWGFLYSSNFIMSIVLPMRKFLASFQSSRTLKLLREYQPAIVVSTQAAPSGIIAYLKSKGLYRGKLVVVFSDYHLHPFWLFDETDLYICNIQQQADILKQMGVPSSKIAVTGMPLPDKFLTPVNKEEAASATGLLTTMPVVLVTSGGRARGAIKEVFLRLLRSNKSFQVVLVCGRNEELKQELEKISAPVRHPTKILGYVDNMDMLMAAATVMVGKTGGPTMAEAVARRLPMVLTDVRPGHEQENLNYLTRNDVVVFGRIPAEVVYLVESVLDGKRLVNLDKAYELIIKPKGSISVTQALTEIKPAPPVVKVQNYQTK
jgi:processive 1,2-diacylglycerol beta-glucosyltransferase